MLGVGRTPHEIPRSEYLTHQGWPRKDAGQPGLPFDERYGFSQPEGNTRNHNRNEPLATPVSAGLSE